MDVVLVYDKEITMSEERKRAVLVCCCVVLVAVFCCILALTASVAGASADEQNEPECGWNAEGPVCLPTLSSPLPTVASPLPTAVSPLPTPVIPDQAGPSPTPTVSYREDCDLCLRLVQSGLVGAWECIRVCAEYPPGLPPTECGVDLITAAGDACNG